MLTKLLPFAAVAVLAVSLAGCGDEEVSVDNLEQEISSQLEAQVGRAPDDVDCPDALLAEVGADARCTLTDGEVVYGLTVTVTEVDGDRALFDIVVDDAPQS